MDSFVYDQPAGRVVFGENSFSRLRGEVDRLGLTRIMVIATPGRRARAESAAALLAGLTVEIYAEAVTHVPVEIAVKARETARRLAIDGLVTVGGGSTIGLGKVVALETGLPIIAIPTTYAGSEMTPVYGLTKAGAKKTGRSANVLPKTVIYDPELTLDLPVRTSVVSGINGIAHCVEALYAKDGNPLLALMAEDGIRALSHSLRLIAAEPRNRVARAEALYGAWLGGCMVGHGMALHHKLCHLLGGTFNLPHAETHTAVLPHVAAYNAAAAPAALARVARALGCPDAGKGLYDLGKSLGAEMALGKLGLKESDLDRAADLAVESPYYNPRPVERAAVRALLADALAGRSP